MVPRRQPLCPVAARELQDAPPLSPWLLCRVNDRSPRSYTGYTGFLAGAKVRASQEGRAALLGGWVRNWRQELPLVPPRHILPPPRNALLFCPKRLYH